MQWIYRKPGWMTVLPALFAGTVLANYVQVSNTELRRHNAVERHIEVQFDLRWDNSWRNDLNHDAAWVFVKFKPLGSNEWEHAYLSPVRGHHEAAIGSRIDTVSDGMGVFISSASDIAGETVVYKRTRLLWQYGTNGFAFADGEEVDIAVHAIEMVHVPDGAFFLGCGSDRAGNFTNGGWVEGNTLPVAVTNEAAIAITNAPGALWASTRIGNPGELSAAYPKGFAGFYCMKYSITQGQYVEFLNLLTESQATERFPDQYGNYRHVVQRLGDPGAYVYSASNAPDRACNYLSWADGCAYAAWTGLRPMTELEYEKACRGPAAPVVGENAWGTTDYAAPSGLQGVDGSGTEWYVAGNAAWHGWTDPMGPIRVGVFATNGADRVSAGASFWGILGLSGNVWEQTVRVDSDQARLFSGTHGGGRLTLPADWPADNRQRGSSGATHYNRMAVSARDTDTATGRTFANGWRGVRSASTLVGE